MRLLTACSNVGHLRLEPSLRLRLLQKSTSVEDHSLEPFLVERSSRVSSQTFLLAGPWCLHCTRHCSNHGPAERWEGFGSKFFSSADRKWRVQASGSVAGRLHCKSVPCIGDADPALRLGQRPKPTELCSSAISFAMGNVQSRCQKKYQNAKVSGVFRTGLQTVCRRIHGTALFDRIVQSSKNCTHSVLQNIGLLLLKNWVPLFGMCLAHSGR